MLAMPDVKAYLAAQGLDPFVTTLDQYATVLKMDSEKYEKLIKANDIKAE